MPVAEVSVILVDGLAVALRVPVADPVDVLLGVSVNVPDWLVLAVADTLGVLVPLAVPVPLRLCD